MAEKTKRAKSFRELETPIKLDGFTLIGYYPYETARIRGLKVPRQVYDYITDNTEIMQILDNKIVLVFQDDVRFGTHDFALFLHDCGGIIGSHEDIIDY